MEYIYFKMYFFDCEETKQCFIPSFAFSISSSVNYFARFPLWSCAFVLAICKSFSHIQEL